VEGGAQVRVAVEQRDGCKAQRICVERSTEVDRVLHHIGVVGRVVEGGEEVEALLQR
jgi:hypothetical protein